MDAGEQTLNLLDTLWAKLQGLPDADPIDLGAFFVLLAFILLVLFMALVACASCCCCCCKSSTKGPKKA